jgi:D-sedoheptulose 7-phosphate isomerase
MTGGSNAELLEQLALSAQRKAQESSDLMRSFFGEESAQIAQCAAALARAFEAGGRLFTFGNGGSACDAEHVAVEFLHPIIEKRRPLVATALTTSSALLTAIGNDHDFSHAFARQLELQARTGDVALGISSSGQSPNVNRAMKIARGRGLLTIGFAGRDGGRLASECEYAFVVPSYSIHRIQEVHVALLHVLWDSVHLCLGEPDVL